MTVLGPADGEGKRRSCDLILWDSRVNLLAKLRAQSSEGRAKNQVDGALPSSHSLPGLHIALENK